MNPVLEYLTGMDKLTDQVIAMDFLTAAKSGIRNYAMAATETVTPEIKETLARHLEEAVDLHERLVSYMMERGYYKPWDVRGQIAQDLNTIQLALNSPEM